MDDRVSDERVTHATEHPDLKRGIGPWLLLFFVLGDMVGAGIYALVLYGLNVLALRSSRRGSEAG